jgi:prepilin-type N-terminal cleavage/methylation domain-containing protein
MTRGTAGRLGFTLVEVMVAMSIMCVAASVMVAPLYRYAQRTDVVAFAQARNGLLAQQVNRLTALPFDSLDPRAGCATIASGSLPYTRCITLSTVSGAQKRVRLVIAPSNTTVRPDTVIFDRTKPASSNPFSQ